MKVASLCLPRNTWSGPLESGKYSVLLGSWWNLIQAAGVAINGSCCCTILVSLSGAWNSSLNSEIAWGWSHLLIPDLFQFRNHSTSIHSVWAWNTSISFQIIPSVSVQSQFRLWWFRLGLCKSACHARDRQFQLKNCLAFPVFLWPLVWVFHLIVIHIFSHFNMSFSKVSVSDSCSIQTIQWNRAVWTLRCEHGPMRSLVDPSHSVVAFIQYPFISVVVLQFQHVYQSVQSIQWCRIVFRKWISPKAVLVRKASMWSFNLCTLASCSVQYGIRSGVIYTECPMSHHVYTLMFRGQQTWTVWSQHRRKTLKKHSSNRNNTKRNVTHIVVDNSFALLQW